MNQSFWGLFVPLLVIMDPVGNLPLFLAITADLSRPAQVKVAALACATAAGILVGFSLTGEAVLALFGISLPAFQLAGGFIFFIYALQMFQLLPPPNLKSSPAEEAESLSKAHIAFVPLATPLLAGPGAITLVLVWQQTPHPLPFWLLAVAILSACLIVFLILACAPWIRRALGLGGIGVVTRLSGLLLAVIAMQFVIDGLSQVLR